MTKLRNAESRAKPLKFKDLGDLLEAEAQQHGAEHKCWGIFDLGEGNVVTLAWFGTTPEMTALRQQLEALPKAGFGFLSKRASARQIDAALRVNDTKTERGGRKRKVSK